MRRLIILGAGGHGKVAAEIAELTGYERISFLDDKQQSLSDYEVVGKLDDAANFVTDSVFFVAIGDNGVRELVSKKLQSLDAEIATLIHPNAVVSPRAVLGEGSVVMAGAVINPGAKLGKSVIVNTGSSVDHDCVIGDFCHVSVGAHLAGTVRLGSRVFICAGATVSNNICICDDCILAAGGVAIKDIDCAATYYGVPAVALKQRESEK